MANSKTSGEKPPTLPCCLDGDKALLKQWRRFVALKKRLDAEELILGKLLAPHHKKLKNPRELMLVGIALNYHTSLARFFYEKAHARREVEAWREKRGLTRVKKK